MDEAVPAPVRRLMERMVSAAVAYLHESQIRTVDVAEVAERAGIALDSARALFPDNDALDEAVGTYGVMQLSDALTRAMVAAPAGDNRQILIALGTAYLAWAQANRPMYSVLTTHLIQPRRTDSIIRLYDAGFVPLVRRFLGEDERAPSTRRTAMIRAFLYGITELALDDHLDPWLMPNQDRDAELAATITDFVDVMLAAAADR